VKAGAQKKEHAMPTPLLPEQLRSPCHLPAAGFDSTDDLADCTELLGQARAAEAVDFGLAMGHDGYNLFVMGPSGVGKHTLLRQLLDRVAAAGEVPPDWVYVNNFQHPHKPRAIALPHGRGQTLQRDVQQLVDELLVAIPAVFESDEYRSRLEGLENGFAERESAHFRELGDEAGAEEVALLRTPTGFGLAPLKDEEVLSPDAFEKLPEADRKRITATMARMREKLHKLARKAPQWQREKRARVRELNQEFSRLAVEHQLEEMRQTYQDLPAVLDYLRALEDDLVGNAEAFLKGQDNAPHAPTSAPVLGGAPLFRRYQVNALVDHNGLAGAPVVMPDPPTYPNLVGRIEHIEHLGALVTDFSLIKAGALHQANGGYLVLDAHRLLMQPYAWEGLKRALRTAEVKIESLGQMLSLVSTVSIEPEPIPLDLKVILVGERELYYLLQDLDPDFSELFKVVADFEDELPRDDPSQLDLAHLIATLARRESLLPFSRAACERLIETAAREAEDAERLSANMQRLLSRMRESDFVARRSAALRVDVGAVDAALANARRRNGRLAERVQEAILRRTLHIESTGVRVGQINGLAVIELGESRFAHPSRITATVRLGDGEVIDIHKEVNLSGALHSKGVMTLTAFLATRFANTLPLSLTASLTFEQTYGEVEGDSASMAELCALMSAIGDIPIKQSIAITGSVDQYGQMQPIGGVNEKIEGFYRLCAARGLDGDQGVLIPVDNVKHLMLDPEVVQACAEGKFHVWAVKDVDEAIEQLTGLPCGQPDPEGVVPEGSVNYRVAARLLQYSSLRRAYNQPDEEAPVSKRKSPAKRRKKVDSVPEDKA